MMLARNPRRLTLTKSYQQVEANSDIPQLEHIVTDPHVSTTPGDEASIPPSKASKKTSLFGGKGIVICAMLSLATGIAVGAAWSRTHIFADSSKGQPAAQVAPAAAVVTAPNFNEIQNQLNAIARGLSSVQQHINDGVLVVDLRLEDPRIDELVRIGLPAVVVGGPLDGGGFACNLA